MIKLFKKFFNLGNLANESNSISLSKEYKKLKKWSLSNKNKTIESFLENNLYLYGNPTSKLAYLEQAIRDNDLNLLHLLYQNFNENRLIHDPSFRSHLLIYAETAMNNNSKEVFEYFIKQYHSKYSHNALFNSDFSVRFFMNNVIDTGKMDYFHILEKYNLANFNDYIKEIISTISNINKVNEEDLIRIASILDYFPTKVDKDNLFLYACYGGEGRWPNKEVIQFLIKRGADIYTEEGKGLIYAGQAKSVDVVESLLKEDSYRCPHEPFSPVETKYGGKIHHIASICAQVQYNENVIKCFLDYGAYIDVVKYKIDREMYPWLEKYSDTKKLHNELNSELNITQPTTQSKPKKLKV
jgi:hypothetical protein